MPFKDIFAKPAIEKLASFLKNAQQLLKDYTDEQCGSQTAKRCSVFRRRLQWALPAWA
ncbi:hypothetical protein [Bacillus glycinifermentans]|uniref:hypothetical protein n=1 Tax=Bacillus glycinifermentans TaxID=1664069 RepID=UPI001FF3C167|nr:hypothetical protein [Bacillus glycinifermentans]UOY90939.1 hypothetical protein MW696_05630 [Bacillus glycinifermentans]